jgi:hypothetical protein
MTIKQMYYALIAGGIADSILGFAFWFLLFTAFGII